MTRQSRFDALALRSLEEARGAGFAGAEGATGCDLLAWTRDGSRLLCAASEGLRVRVLDVPARAVVQTIELGAEGVSELALAPDDSSVALVTRSGVLRTIAFPSGDELARVALPGSVLRTTLAWTTDARCIAYLTERLDPSGRAGYAVGAWEPRTGRGRFHHEVDAIAARLGMIVPTPTFATNALAATPDDRAFELLLSTPDQRVTVALDVASGTMAARVWEHRPAELGVCARVARGTEVVGVAQYADSCGWIYKSELVRWSIASSDTRWAVKHDGGRSLTVSPCERWFLVWDDTWVQLRSMSDGALLGRFTLRGGADHPRCIAIAPDGRRLAVGTARGQVWVLALTPRAPAAR